MDQAARVYNFFVKVKSGRTLDEHTKLIAEVAEYRVGKIVFGIIINSKRTVEIAKR